MKALGTLGILVVSDRSASGVRPDTAGPLIEAWGKAQGLTVRALEIVPDEKDAIVSKLQAWADQEKYALVLTTGGTGLSSRDVTPEATRPLLDREIPGLPELMRTQTAHITHLSALSRGVAGTRGQTLILNLPGSPKAVQEWLALLQGILPHLFDMLAGKTHEAEKA